VIIWPGLRVARFLIKNVHSALETHNGSSSLDANEKAIHAASALKLPSISGSDRHSVEQVGRACTEFVNPVHTIDDVIEEIKRGNCHGIYT